MIFKTGNVLLSFTYLHLFDSTSQNVQAVLGILDSVFNDIYLAYGKREIYLRSDNAACYHNQSLVALAQFLAKKHQLVLKRYDFCEPQNGKDICDRKISPIKRAIYQYANEGNDVVNASQMKKAIESKYNCSSTKVYVCETNQSLNIDHVSKIPKVSEYHSFVYNDNSVETFKYFNVGKGKRSIILQYLKNFIPI